ncbi:pentatricopeptide repeat-containing protein At5g15340, mitochondrial [Andrographis paniculata]|uniref:pentatricopeptide repeat-containing protein At5g15340, mitochondrial n=1 Tax=Andrographis paniculata TaxID=175694 RepID=UPI0021E8AAC5|nr:pentatricopeptide repeat-containing protein At5g15340, mitochondrial [Andrographis paniculata]
MKWPMECASVSSLARHCRALARSCARLSAPEAGQQLHAAAITAGLAALPMLYLPNVILHMYAACGDLLSARKVFDGIPVAYKDAADWTALIDCCSRCGSPMDSLKLFVVMRRLGVPVDDITVVSVFSICAKLGNSSVGVQLHGCTVKLGLDSCIKSRNSAMDMYIKCGLMADAKRVFYETTGRSVVSWTILLWGVAKWEGLEEAHKLFDEMPEKNEVAWMIMISRYVENGFVEAAFTLLSEMTTDFGLRFDSGSLCTLLSACTQSGDVATGRWAHAYGLRSNMDAATDVRVGTALLDMYAKCGHIDYALRVFKCMAERNVVTWNAILGGLAMHGRATTVLEMFDRMVDEVKPNDVTFTAVLSACSHAGLVDRGREVFHRLRSAYGMPPSMENYACVVDLLGRSGRLDEAEAVIRSMPMKPNEVVLGSLLGACSVHRKPELGERLVQDLIRMYPDNTEHHVLLSNMYASSGRSDKADSFRHDLREKGIRKVPGMSTMFVDGRIHRFSAGERSHPQIIDIYAMLDEMIQKLKSAGYVPDISCQILSGSGDEEAERALMCHSEKLALCFGLLGTKPGTPLYIFKNLRICRDCHSAMKFASRVYGREIVIRDRNRFHSFKHGLCSCSDYW